MKHYLISGFLHFEDLSHRPYVGYAALQPSEVMDRDTVRTVQHLLLEEAQSFSAQQGLPLPAGFRAHSFQPFETSAAVQPEPAPAVHLNPADFAALPPVDSPLLIEIAPGVLVLASRPAHAEQKGDDLRFDLPSGGHVVGRFRWTHR